jgi:hypothetical protein
MDKSRAMRALEVRHGRPIEQILAGFLTEEPALSTWEIAVKLEIGERTLRRWAKRMGCVHERASRWRVPCPSE